MKPLGAEREHYWRVQRMARAAGADPAAAWAQGALDAADWTALVARCRSCPWPEGCARWLARFEGAELPPHKGPPAACINRDTLTALAQDAEEETPR